MVIVCLHFYRLVIYELGSTIEVVNIDVFVRYRSFLAFQ